jgi:hypothetical protein
MTHRCVECDRTSYRLSDEMEPLRPSGIRHGEHIIRKDVERHGRSDLRELGLAVPAHIQADNSKAIRE